MYSSVSAVPEEKKTRRLVQRKHYKCPLIQSDFLVLERALSFWTIEKSWEIFTWDVPNHPTHTLTLQHSTWSGQRIISVNGVELLRASHFFDDGSQHDIEFEGEKYQVCVVATPLRFEYQLYFRDHQVPEDKPVDPDEESCC